MKWRCTWCGKPHAEDDPPCDECGHNVFERAVVQTGEERRDSAPRTVDTGTTYVWACPNCGREHVRNNPPCSRCGNPDLEKTEQRYDDVDLDLDVPGWLEVAKPYAPIFAVVGLVLFLFATGIISPSVLPGIGTPSPPDAPGEGTEAAGIDLETAEREIHDRLEAERSAAESRTVDDGLSAYAEYENRRLVASEYGDSSPETARVSEFDPDCGGTEYLPAPFQLTGTPIDGYDGEADLADAVVSRLLEMESDDELTVGFDVEGVDLHVAPDGTIVVFYVAC